MGGLGELVGPVGAPPVERPARQIDQLLRLFHIPALRGQDLGLASGQGETVERPVPRSLGSTRLPVEFLEAA